MIPLVPDTPTPVDKRVCICFITPERYWTIHYGSVEPGSQMEPNPDCLVHFPRAVAS